MRLKTEHEQRVNIENMNQQKINFFTYISHDTKTPLTTILSPLQRLIQQPQISNNDKEKLEVIYRNANRMNYLINELLTFSKIEMKQMRISVRKGDIMHFLEELSHIFDIVAGEREIDFIVNLEDTEEEVWFSPSKLERILYNLLSNAFKYTQPGGYVKLSAKLIKEEKGTFVQISVKDNGRGFLKKLKNKYLKVTTKLRSATIARIRTGIIAYAFAHTHAQRGNPGRKRNQQRFGFYRYPECIRGCLQPR